MDIIYRYDPHKRIAPSHDSPMEAQAALREGNLRFHAMVSRVRAEVMGDSAGGPYIIEASPLSLGFPMVAGQAPMQSPFALFLGCSDARAPVEVIFDQSNNDLFVVRVAGNVLGTECLGSAQYAASQFARSLRLVVVLGHTGCGAVAAAVDLYLDPDAFGAIAETQALRSIVDRLLVVVRVADKALQRLCGPGVGDRAGYREALWEMSVYLNAALTSHDLARELAVAIENGLRVVYCVYDLVTQRVFSRPDLDDTFAPAPRSGDDFTRLSDLLARSVLDRGIIGPL